MSRLTMNFDAVAAATPQDATAAAVRDGSGETYDKAHPSYGDVHRWSAPPPMKGAGDLSPPGRKMLAEMRGQRFGRMVIAGIWAETSKSQGVATWVCRCDCGYYEGRRLKRLVKAADSACCSHCAQTDRLREMAAQPSTSKTRQESAKALDRMARGIAP